MFTYVFVTLSILQSQYIEKGFQKAENSEQNVVLQLFLFTLEFQECMQKHSESVQSTASIWAHCSFVERILFARKLGIYIYLSAQNCLRRQSIIFVFCVLLCFTAAQYISSRGHESYTVLYCIPTAYPCSTALFVLY